VFVASGIQQCNAHAPHYIVICALPRSTIFFNIISLTARFSKKKKKLMSNKCVFSFSLQILSKTSLLQEEMSEI